MARTPITASSIDLNSDDGSVLLSFVQGEQLEYAITLNFLTNAGAGYIYEAVVMEGLNEGAGDIPTQARVGGRKAQLRVRVPVERGLWQPANPYSREDVVSYNNLYYKRRAGFNVVDNGVPSASPSWERYVPNKVFVQFPEELTITPAWTPQPTAEHAIYGFFELSVREPSGGPFQRVWKPIRGLLKFDFSPTHLVTDADPFVDV